MDNVLLGKVVKAMYKLSGKTLPQLADETGLTLDTINNFFYARVQKPSFFGVASLVKATGYSMPELVGFMEKAKELPENADIVDEFTKYLFTVEDTRAVADSAKQIAEYTEEHEEAESRNMLLQIQTLNEQHEKQLDRFRATHFSYVEQLNERYKEQIAQMEETNRKLKEHYDHSVGEIKKTHAQELDREREELSYARKLNRTLVISVIIEAAAAVALGIGLVALLA